ncbi:hypothetical protein ACNF40_04135 [Cuniculiplasma sp. SKW4]|uniref:hypothetical protein n=1 Tax=Cuniculiplasma sp. SKW4 TaxID=3400171 RepID=UPI003FD68343
MIIPDKDVVKYMEWPSPLMSERPTYWQIAKKIGKSPNYVKNMIDEMLHNESLRGMSVFINPTMIGLKSYFLVVMCENSQIIESEDFRREIGGIYSIHFSGVRKEIINVEMYKENDDQMREVMDKIVRMVPDCHVLYSTYEIYENVTLDQKTLEIVRYLIQRPMDSINRISLSTGIPRNVVEKKIERMTSGDIINIRPNFNAYRYRKLNLAVISVAYSEDLKKEVKKQIMEILGDYIIQERRNIKGIFVFLTSLPHLDDGKPVLDKLNKIDGAMGVTLVFPFESNFYIPDILKERFEKATGKPWEV